MDQQSSRFWGIGQYLGDYAPKYRPLLVSTRYVTTSTKRAWHLLRDGYTQPPSEEPALVSTLNTLGERERCDRGQASRGVLDVDPQEEGGNRLSLTTVSGLRSRTPNGLIHTKCRLEVYKFQRAGRSTLGATVLAERVGLPDVENSTRSASSPATRSASARPPWPRLPECASLKCTESSELDEVR